MEQTVEQLIAERSYSSLNEKEREQVAELCANEHEFNQMKQFFLGMSAMSTASVFEPSASVKSSLDAVFASKHGGIGARLTPREPAPVKVIPFHQHTWVRVAAGVILVAGVFSIWRLTDQTVKNETVPQLAKNEAPVVKAPEKVNEAAAREIPKEAVPEPMASTAGMSEGVAMGGVGSATAESTEMFASPPPPPAIAADTKGTFSFSPAKSDASVKDQETEDVKTTDFAVISGRQADLYPDGNKKKTAENLAGSVASSKEDLLSYLAPAF